MLKPKPKDVQIAKNVANEILSAKSTVQSLAKGFKVLQTFTDEREDLTLSEVALGAGLDAGTTFRLLNTLVELGYVRRDDRTRRFSLTLKVLDLGFNAIGRRDLRAIVRPALRRLVGGIGEAASFAVLDRSDVLYIERVRAGLVRLGVDIRIGTSIPAHISVIGQTILAFLSPAELEAFMAAGRGRDHDFRDKRAPEQILPILKAIRSRGYMLGDSTLTEGMRILAVPVLEPDGQPIGAVSIAVPATRGMAENLEGEPLKAVREAVSEIAKAIGASGNIGFAL